MSEELVNLLFFGSMILCLGIGVPISIALGGLSVILISQFMSVNALALLPIRAFGSASSFEFTAIPMFIFMASVLERSGVAEELYDGMKALFGRLKGGLAVGTVLICTLFAAMAGVSSAATVAMGLVALPAMLSRGYSKGIALGTVAAGGSLGILIPPSVTMILYGLVASTSIGKLYAGGVLPGLLIAGLFIIYILLRCNFGQWKEQIDDELLHSEEAGTSTFRVLRGLVLPFLLISAVLFCILGGITSITEAAAVGGLGSIIIALVRRGFDGKLFLEAADATLLLTCLIFWIIIGAGTFSTIYNAIGAADLFQDVVFAMEVDRYVILALMLAILFVMGMLIETTGIIMITVPIFVPVIMALGFDPVWFGILFIIMMEIGFLTPPFGYNLFYLKGVAPPSVTIIDIYKSVFPYVLLMLLGLVSCMFFPSIVTFLPDLVFSQ